MPAELEKVSIVVHTDFHLIKVMRLKSKFLSAERQHYCSYMLWAKNLIIWENNSQFCKTGVIVDLYWTNCNALGENLTNLNNLNSNKNFDTEVALPNE